MIFNSVTYVVFLVVVVTLYWRLPQRPRLMLLFLASLTFYGFWRIDFLALLLGSVALDYVLALLIARAHGRRLRFALACVSVASNLGILAFFKYASFALETVTGIGAWLGYTVVPPEWKVILPLGVSFYIFHSLSYVLDVYRRFVPAQRDYMVFATYVMFFPQLVAGPVLRAREVIWQLAERPPFKWDDIAHGVRRILVGLFLKVVLADNIAGLVDNGFTQAPASLSALDVWTLAFLFGFQIYFDFSAYSHIAIGSARLMGIHFPENFRFPYQSRSPREFWRRWHISLSSWVRDYLYLPLCGAKVRDNSVDGLATATDVSATPRAYGALWLSWALMGLWHGANWTFVVWGLWHALLVTLHRLLPPLPLPKAVAALGGIAVTMPLVMLGWIPFRAQTLADTLTMWGRVIEPPAYANLAAPRLFGLLPQPLLTLSRESYVVVALMVVATGVASFLAHRVLPRWTMASASRQSAETVAWAVCVALVFIYLRPVHQFIYFQF